MKQIKQIMMVIMLMTGIFTSCEMMHEDIPECNRVILKFNNVTANDTDTFGLYVLSKNDIIVEENIKVSSNYEIEKDLYETRGDKYFIYTPYLSIPDGMPVKGDKASSYDIMVFFKPIATRSPGIVRVARGTRMCREKCATYRFHFYEWQEEVPGWKTSSNQK